MPLFLAVALWQYQAALHGHARVEAGVVANETASLVGHAGVPPSVASQQAKELLIGESDLDEVVVEISERPISPGVWAVVVDVRARSAGLVPGTSIDVVVRGVAVTSRRSDGS